MSSRGVIEGGRICRLVAAKTPAKQKQIGVTLVGRRNHHLHQPLLDQVAMAGLRPAGFAVPMRGLVSRLKIVRVLGAR